MSVKAKMDCRQGITRLWFVISALWVAYASIHWDALYHVTYLYDYHVQREQLETIQQKEDACRYDAAVDSVMQPDQRQARVRSFAAADTNPDVYAEARRVAKRTGVPVDTVITASKDTKQYELTASTDTEYALCVNKYRAHDPEWNWLAWIALPPTAGLLSFVLLVGGAFHVARWVVRGFRQ